MGNSSSAPSSSSDTTTHGGKYDVFLSFRGEDTRDSFTSHLYKALDDKQIKTFIDNQLVRGEEISAGLLSVIRESKISVVIFSENYASSKWCLRELAEIMKCREMNNQIVIPVFYRIDPSHIRKQIGSYEAAFAKHENGLQQDEVKKWREALTQASNISGFDSSKARNEAEFACDIVRDVWNKLNNIWPSCDFKGLVGIDKHIEQVVSLLCLGVSDFRIIGIWGMGGMGKTTIADAVFHLVSHQFENRTYFARCVREQSEKDSSGLFRLRDDIISKLLNEENQKIDSPSIPQWIKEMLNRTKVLIVLDDVDKLEILEILAGGFDQFGPESRIILTTRDKQVLRNCGVEDRNMYEVKGLNHDEALQLFCNYAFKQNHPTKDFEVLSREVVEIATNVPLAVKVLGSLLYKKRKRDWENAVHKFQRNVNPDVLDVLKISYDGLDEEEKGLFLDIACFVEFEFKIDEEDFAPNLLSDREFSLSGLIDKSLVTVEDCHIKMHDLLREMGREIATKNRSRLWRPKDVLRTLKHNDGTTAVQGIFLNMLKCTDLPPGNANAIPSPRFSSKQEEISMNLRFQSFASRGKTRLSSQAFEKKYDLKCMDLHLSSQAFEKMYDLRTLIITYGSLFYKESVKVHLSNGDLDYLPDELRYLHWESYPLEVLPSSFDPMNLVELDLSSSNIKQLWEGRTCVPKLKRLRLYYCMYLIKIPDLSDIPSAESINLECCQSLPEIHSSRECPKNLLSLQLSSCRSLSSFPSNIHIEGSEFSLSRCIRLTKFPHISGNIKELDLSGSGVEEVPSTIWSLSKLESLNMKDCTRLKRISKSICKLKSLDRLDLSRCCKLESFPDILEGMKLKYLNLSGTAIKELPPSIGNLNRLEELDLSDCKNLEMFPSRISNLNLFGCFKLEKLHPLSVLCSLNKLKLNNSNLTEISEDIGCLSSLERLELEGNVFKRLPKSIKKLSKLNYLGIRYCGMLQSLPELPSSLERLEAMNCKQLKLIQSLPDEYVFELCADGSGSLYFNFFNCKKLNQKAVSNLFQDSLLKMQLMGTEKIISLFERGLVEGSICLPGSEIPEWFSYKNKGSSITIPLLRNDCRRSCYIMGFAVCLVIEELRAVNMNYDSSIHEDELNVLHDFHIETSDGHKGRLFHNPFPLFRMPIEGNESMNSDHIILGYESMNSDHIILGYNLSSKCYEFFQEMDTPLANRSMSDYVGISFEFKCLWWHRVKYCGIQPIYVQAQLMNSIAINKDTGDTSGSNDTEETCDRCS